MAEMIKWECCECGTINLTEKDKAYNATDDTLFFCGRCGLVHRKHQIVPEGFKSSERSYLECQSVRGIGRSDIPMGFVSDSTGKERWTDITGKILSREEFVFLHGRDPKTWWNNFHKT